jgi:peptidyl-prolyl cis-trans isomerase C
MKSAIFCAGGALALALAIPASAVAAETELAKVADKVSVNTGDILGDALRIPPEQRKGALAKPEAIQQLANNLVIRRALAAEAEAAGLAKDPAIQGALRVARDRVLSDAMFTRMDMANKPSREAVEALARSTYNANPKRFDLPDETGTSHILIKRETPDAKAKIEAIEREVKAGGDFAALARKHSQDASASNGGLLGYFPAGNLVPEYEAAAKSLQKPGDVSGVVESQFGYHVIRLEGRRPAGVRTFDQVKDVLMREIEVKILNDKRLEQVKRLQDGVVLNKAGIEAFAETHK